MDGFAAFILVMFFVGGISFSAGRYTPLADVKSDCAKAGETTIQGTIIKCKPVAAWVDGKRVEFVEQ
jgi:hypothetical protein